MYETFTFDAADGKKIFVHSWTEVRNPVGVVQILHGMGEHSLRYVRFAEFLNANGYLVYANDHRGHGKTAGSQTEYGYLGKDGFERTVGDAKTLSDIIKAKHPRLPLVAFGHSYGALLLQEYIIKHGSEINGAMFSGPACFIKGKAEMNIKSIVPIIMNAILGGRMKSAFIDSLATGQNNKAIPNPRTKYDWLSHDTEQVDRYVADEYCGGVLSINFYYYLGKGLKGISKINRVRNVPQGLPLLIMAGAEDPVGKFGKMTKDLADTYSEVGIKDVGLKIFEGARHEILNELIYEQAHSYILAWLDRHFKQDF